MFRIEKHPVLDITKKENITFNYEGQQVAGEKGFTIAAALHQAGYPVHSHSLKNRSRSLECGIGKCGACEMLVDGEIKRICITPVDNVKEVSEIPREYKPGIKSPAHQHSPTVYKTSVAIIGAGPSGLAARAALREHGVDCLVIDNNNKTGGQFLMQTHQFFFFEKEKKFGGMRGFDIAASLAGEDEHGIFLNSTVWDILEGRRLAVKNIKTGEIFYVESDYLVVATGAVPFMPAFENDDLPGVYTAAVIQKMMNQEFTLLGKNVLTVGAGNIGYLTSYQLMQAGANVKAIIEAMPHEGGFPVQANRVRRLGIPVMLSKILVKAIPNENEDGIIGAVIADSENFRPVKGTEQEILGIDAINICTGLVPDDSLLVKGREIFGRNCFGSGDATRIGEGTTAVLKGRQAALEIIESMGNRYDYNHYLSVSKEYIDSQQHPFRVKEEPYKPSQERALEKPFVIIDCLYGFACNPCEFACRFGAITKTSTSTVPHIDYDKCTGCMECTYQCPGLAIFGYNLKKNQLFLPVEYDVEEGKEVFLVDNNGEKLGEGVIAKVLKKKTKTNIARVNATDIEGEALMHVRGFIAKDNYPEPLVLEPHTNHIHSESYICHCDDVKMDDILKTIGDRKFISVDEIKHTTRLGMGACRGKRCIKRLKQSIKLYDKTVVGEATPRGPLSNQLEMGELYPHQLHERVIPVTLSNAPVKRVKVASFIAGGGMGGSALFRYMSEAGLKPVMANYGHGASWRNIAGGRPQFSLPELSDIAARNLDLFRELDKKHKIDFYPTRYVTFAHDEAMQRSLEDSLSWQKGKMVDPSDFEKEISPAFNGIQEKYLGALITENCWQASPGKVVDMLRSIGVEKGGKVLEDTRVIDVYKEDDQYRILTLGHHGDYTEYETPVLVNALGAEGAKMADRLGLETGLFAVKHQAFITRRLPMLGHNNTPLPMLIDRRNYKGFVAVYGQQLAETGQIIGCASPAIEHLQTGKNLKINSKEFIEIVSEIFVDWIPELSSVGFQAVWAGYYIEPRMIIDPEKGLFLGLRGQGFMLSQYLAKMYTDSLMGKPTPGYFDRLKLQGDGLLEKAFK